MRRDYINPKRKIRKHLQKRKTNFAGLYIVFVVAVLAIGTISMLLRSDFQSEASEGNSEINAEFFNGEILKQVQDDSIAELGVDTITIPETIELEQGDTLFPRTTKESLLREMVEKEGLELTALEEQYFVSH